MNRAQSITIAFVGAWIIITGVAIVPVIPDAKRAVLVFYTMLTMVLGMVFLGVGFYLTIHQPNRHDEDER